MLPVLLALLALLLLLLARRARRQAGLPAGIVVYTDTGGWARAEAPLFSARLGLTGKPDYLVQRRGEVLPVEVKSMPAPADGPHASHVYQVAAYCALVTEAYDRRPAYGLIKYADQTLAVPFTAALEAELEALLAQIRVDRAAAEVPRSHNAPARCRACGFREVCDESLVSAE